jgi:hypothetical protein
MLLRRYGPSLLVFIPCLLFFITGCGNVPNSDPPAKTLAAVSITPATFPLIVGGTQQLTATATYSDGSKADIGASATWASSNKTVATVNLAGMVAAVGSGDRHNIRQPDGAERKCRCYSAISPYIGLDLNHSRKHCAHGRWHTATNRSRKLQRWVDREHQFVRNLDKFELNDRDREFDRTGRSRGGRRFAPLRRQPLKAESQGKKKKKRRTRA